jgi:hypothetical protein
VEAVEIPKNEDKYELHFLMCNESSERKVSVEFHGFGNGYLLEQMLRLEIKKAKGEF